MNAANSYKINPQIFREYDIRGVADRDLTDEASLSIGKAYGSYLKRLGKNTISLARDSRVSSPRIHSFLLKGILSTGLNVIDIGLTTTPCLYFSIFHLKTQGGLMITGSHNPPDQNGIKMCIDTSSLFGAQIQELKQMIEKSDFEQGTGKLEKKETLVQEYQKYIQSLFKFKKHLKVVFDCGNGMTGLVAPALFKSFGFETIGLYPEVDGHFPNHPADPSEPKNLHDLIERVKKEKAQIGLAFDGDGDRVGVVDELGNIIPGDKLLILYARGVLKSHPGAVILGDVKCSNLLFADIKQHGGKPIMWKTGHSLIKTKMKQEHALLGGEMSGHMFFADRWFGFDSGIYGACRILEILDQTNEPLSKLLADVPKTYATPEIRVDCADDKKFGVVERTTKYFKDSKYQVIDIDGARVEFPDGWGLVRASNTQPVLVMRFEAASETRLGEIKQLTES